MKKFLLVAILLLLRLLLHAQDTLYRLDGTIQLIRVIEVNSEQLRYRQFSDPDGPVFVLSKQAVAKIIYENGTEEIFQTVQVIAAAPTEVSHEQIFKRNILSLYAMDFIWGEYTISYERLTKSGKLGFKMPFSIGYLSKSWYYISGGPFIYLRDNFYAGNKSFSTGFAVNFYPYGQESIPLFVGLSFLIGKIDYQYCCEGVKVPNNIFTGIALITGFLFSLSENFGIVALIGFGYGFVSSEIAKENYYNEIRKLRIPVEINLSFKF